MTGKWRQVAPARTLLVLAAALLLAWGWGARVAAAGEVPAVLFQLGEHAEDMYDLVKAGDWATAGHEVVWLKGGLGPAEATVADRQADKEQLHLGLEALESAVASHNRLEAMRQANRLTGLVSDMSRPFAPAVPVDVARLDYLGRELEVASVAGDTARLAATAQEIQRTWAALRPLVIGRRGRTEAARFDGLMARLQEARRPADYSRLATPILDEVDNLERVFARPRPPAPPRP